MYLLDSLTRASVILVARERNWRCAFINMQATTRHGNALIGVAMNPGQ